MDLTQVIEQKLDELEQIIPSENEPHLPREERRYALEQIAATEETTEAKIKAVREATPLEMYQVSMF